LFSVLGNRFPSAFLVGAIAIVTLSMLLLFVAATHTASISLLAVLWGMGMMAIGLAMQIRVLALAPDATDVAMALFSGIFNLGIGAGALLGNQVSLHLGMANVGYTGGVMGCAALAWCITIFRRYPQLRATH